MAFFWKLVRCFLFYPLPIEDASRRPCMDVIVPFLPVNGRIPKQEPWPILYDGRCPLGQWACWRGFNEPQLSLSLSFSTLPWSSFVKLLADHSDPKRNWLYLNLPCRTRPADRILSTIPRTTYLFCYNMYTFLFCLNNIPFSRRVAIKNLSLSKNYFKTRNTRQIEAH